MPEELIISISGMRGIIGENLTSAIAADYGCAFGTFLKRSAGDQDEKLKVCIGRDSRVSGPMILSAVASGLCSAGIDVVDLGIVPTPSVGVMITHLGCAGGVVITASHNPVPYNGIKLLLGNGIAPPADMAQKIRQCYFDKDFDTVGSVDCGSIACTDKTNGVHIDKVRAIVNPETIIAKRFKVVLDSVNGAGGRIGEMLLERFGCEVIGINIDPTGIFAHTPEPTKDNLVSLCDKMNEVGADIGFAQDPDADRLAIVDQKGTYIGEEYTLAMAAMHVFSKTKGNAAANLSTSRMIDDVAERAGCNVLRTAVGEANVAQAMVNNKCVIGGEGNGGIIDLRVGPVRDSLVGMALVLELMAETGKTVSQLVDQVGCYYVDKAKFAADKATADAIIEKAKLAFPQAKINTLDGCRFDFEDGWVHLRTSNTEPVMRVIVETETEAAAKKYIDIVASIRSEIVK
ncbi:MAG: phosphoglucosamine mutase [Anaerohalosphaera sp.]|nr:phosphoglucosamine mutase [Anaerohalosphaera sp.]